MTITRKIQAEAIFHGTVIVEGREVNKESDTFFKQLFPQFQQPAKAQVQ